MAAIDPKFKKYLSEYFEDQLHKRMGKFEDELFTDTKIASRVHKLGLQTKVLRDILADPHIIRAEFDLDGEAGEMVNSTWEKVSPHIGDSEPTAARLYFNRAVLKHVLQATERMLKMATGVPEPLPFAYTPTSTSVPHPASEPSTPSPSLSTAWEEYAADVGMQWSKSTRNTYAFYIEEFISDEFVGDLPVSQLIRDDLIRYRNMLHGLPANRKKLRAYRDKSVQQLLEMEIPDDDLLADRTINERLIHIGSLLNWCKAVKEYTTKDLTYGIRIKNPDSKERADFSSEDIARLFDIAHYRPRLVDCPYKFWIPLLSLYSGARLSELAQLKPDDVFEQEGIPVFRVIDMAEGQRVKTKAGKRLIPLHDHLIHLGFLDYVRQMRQVQAERLFMELRVAEKAGDAASKWFTRFRRLREVDDVDSLGRERVFHSFRHTVTTRLMHGEDEAESSFPTMLVQQIIGHESKGVGETATYTKDYSMKRCRAVINSLSYELDIEKLKECWDETWRHYSQWTAKA